MLSHALKYLNAGLCPIPLWPDAGKNPKIKDTSQYHHRLPTPNEVRRWWSKWPTANIGLITGYHGNYVGLDFDTFESYEAWEGPKGQSWTVQTKRGYHVWFRLQTEPEKSKNYTDADGEHEVLVRAKGGYLIGPPSQHFTGCYYKTVHNVKPILIGQISDIIFPFEPKTTQHDAKTSTPPKWTGSIADGIRIQDLITPDDDVKPNKRGAYLVACPFHPDKRPSAWINIEQQRFGCNVCWPDQYLDVINVYAELKGISNGEAYKQVMEARQ